MAKQTSHPKYLPSKKPKLKDQKLWKNNKQCPVCGFPANPEIFSCETGYNYCSDECARQHVKALEPKGGY